MESFVNRRKGRMMMSAVSFVCCICLMRQRLNSLTNVSVVLRGLFHVRLLKEDTVCTVDRTSRCNETKLCEWPYNVLHTRYP